MLKIENDIEYSIEKDTSAMWYSYSYSTDVGVSSMVSATISMPVRLVRSNIVIPVVDLFRKRT